MKTVPLTAGPRPRKLHQTSAKRQGRNPNGKASHLMERGERSGKVTTAANLAAALRRWQERVPRKERLEIARRIEQARQ